MKNNRLELTDGCIHSLHREIVGFIDSLEDKEYLMLEAYLKATKKRPRRSIYTGNIHIIDQSSQEHVDNAKKIMMEYLKYISHNDYLPLKYVIKTISKEEYDKLNTPKNVSRATCPECEAEREAHKKSMGFFQTIKRLLKGE